MTVYDDCHIGHARLFLVFDMLVRYLRSQGYEVTYVRNITDIDDKIIARAIQNQETIEQLTLRYTQRMHEDLACLSVLPPTYEPRATEHISGMITLIQNLIDQGFAYVAPSGDVYYQVRRFAAYGQLAHRNLEDLLSGARVEINEEKRDVLDFVLWKTAKPGEPTWASPWGPGRPGWHIECSVMCMHAFGATCDIHGGGMDLKFPHHENERAQSEAITQKPYVNLWMHNGFVQSKQDKMSKSLGNFITIREFLSKENPEVLRYLMLSSHYRGPVEFTEEQVAQARSALERFYVALRGLDLTSAMMPENTEFETRFHAAMQDDLNTPEALAVLFEMTRILNRVRLESESEAARWGRLLCQLAQSLGLLLQTPEQFLCGQEKTEDIEVLIQARNAARAQKNWAEADKIRDILWAQDIVLEDTNGDTLWRRRGSL
jgi:cysteinyl-tRNA synthetase